MEVTNTDSLSDLEKGEVNLEYLSNEEELVLEILSWKCGHHRRQ